MANVRLLSAAAFSGMFVFGLVMALLGAVLPAVTQRIGLDLAQAGALFLVMNFCMLLCSLALGPEIDRNGMKGPMLIGAVAVATALLLIAYAPGYPMLLLGVAILGGGGGGLNSATNTLIADLHADERQKNAALNLLGVFFGFGALLMPFGIGTLIERLPLETLMLGAALLCAAVAAFSAAITFPPPKQAGEFPFRTMGRFLRVPLVGALGLLLFCESGNEFLLGGYISTYLTRELGMTLSEASYALAAFWGATMAARALFSRLLLRLPGYQVLAGSAALSAVAALALIWARTPEVAIAAVVLLGGGLAAIYPTALGVAGAAFEKNSGAVFGLLFTMGLTGGMLVPWSFGQIAAATGIRPALAIAPAGFAVILAISALLPSLARRQR